MSIILINCSTAAGALGVVDAVQAGDLWGVDMGTTSSASCYLGYALVECTNTRNLAIMDNCPEGETYTVSYSRNEPDSFAESGTVCKAWFLRGLLS